jgi:hypothetical protein
MGIAGELAREEFRLIEAGNSSLIIIASVREVLVPFRSSRVVLLLLFALLLPLEFGGQVPIQRTTPPYASSTQTQEDEARAKMERDMEKRRNEDRQKQIKRDAEKLLQLATELKGYVDKSNENVLSMDVVKKADEIEKYARSVKDKMKAQ